MFNFFKTGTEIKRDDYYKLYQNLKSALAEHDRKVSAAKQSYSSYRSSVPNLSNSKIPSNDFDLKREELNATLQRHFDRDKQKRSSLTSAMNKAYERYMHYKHLALREAEEEARKRRERLERLLHGKR